MSLRQVKYLIPVILFTFIFESCVLDKPKEEVILSGKVTDSSGAAISDVTINIELVSEKITIKTSSEGSFNVLISHGGVAIITFSKEDYIQRLVKTAFKDGESKTIDVRMSKI